MIPIKTNQEIEIMRQGGRILAQVFAQFKKALQPGVRASELDQLAEKMIKKAGAQPAFKGYKDYPYSTCISINDELVHGLPLKNKIIKNGDLVKIDCGVYYCGFNTDAAMTIGVGKISPQARKLLKTTKGALDRAIALVRPGLSLKSIQKEIQNQIEKAGFGVIRDLTGHGIGQKLQEEPVIPNFPRNSKEIILKKGMTFCFEPMVSAGDWQVITKDDGWTVVSQDGSLTAHFEHTIAVTEDGCEILTD